MAHPLPGVRRLLISSLLLGALVPAQAEADPGDWGIFSTMCEFSHANFDDPIVYPGQPGAAHRHSFFGNRTTDAYTTTRSLASTPTSCDRRQDHAAYWVPSLYENGEALKPYEIHIYIRNTNVRDKASIVPFPKGLRMIAGTDAHAEPPKGERTAEWSCAPAGQDGTAAVPPTCDGKPLLAIITFPSCWDGRRLTSADQSHVLYPWEHRAYPRGCPASHPIVLPELTEHVRYLPSSDDLTGLTLSSGPSDTLHADFWNAWEKPTIARLVADCLWDGIECGTIGGTDP